MTNRLGKTVEPATKIINDEGNQCAPDQNRKQQRIDELRYKAAYSSNILRFLLSKLMEIQDSHIRRVIDDCSRSN